MPLSRKTDLGNGLFDAWNTDKVPLLVGKSKRTVENVEQKKRFGRGIFFYRLLFWKNKWIDSLVWYGKAGRNSKLWNILFWWAGVYKIIEGRY